ncbi:MAG: TonB family protein [Candidatus Acidiferrum sp.]
MRISFLCFLAVAAGVTCRNAIANTDEFQDALAKAARTSTLTAPGAKPFHLKLSATDTHGNSSEFKAELEVWWAAPDKWRRELKSSVFTQTAVQDGTRYSETNSSDYLPFWLHELIQESVDPIPEAQLKDVDVDWSKSGCGKWETEYSKDAEKISVYNSVCFNSNGTAREIFTQPLGVVFADYKSFSGKEVARSLTVWPGGRSEVKAKVTLLELLKADDSLFSIPNDTGFPSRLRFLSVPESALQPDTKANGLPAWPVVHNFPASGLISINVKVDRDGKVREVGSPISKNVVVNDATAAQIKNWKFQPYLVDGFPVQVNTNITLHFDAKMELLGANGKSFPAEPFLAHINKSRALSDPRTEGSPPFHLHATFQIPPDQSGTYEETWLSPTKWRREIQLGSVTLLATQNDNEAYHKSRGAGSTPKELDYLIDLMYGHFPRLDSFQEGDWGQSAVQLGSMDLVRVARGQVDAENRPITGQAYWFDFAGYLRADFVQPRATIYSKFEGWNRKQVPRRAEVSENGKPRMLVDIDKIEPARDVPDSLLVLEGVKPEILGSPNGGQSSDLVLPKPIHKVSPEHPAVGHGTVLVDVVLDAHGHVVDAKIKQSAGEALDAAALKAAMQWEFTPMTINGVAGPGYATLRFDF